MSMKQISVAVLGATGTVGQKLIALLARHPWFKVREVVASERSAGRRYREAAAWREGGDIPDGVGALEVLTTSAQLESSMLFSGLDSSVAGEAESEYARRGHVVISNSRNHRMGADVPLVVPEVNIGHLALVRGQGHSGAIVTNPNCVAIPLTLALAPLHQAVGVAAVQLTSLQAVSGAGYPGVASLDILGNVIPEIAGEEEKVEQEPRKILGTLVGDEGGQTVQEADIAVSAQCVRVPVADGHTLLVSVRLREPMGVEDTRELLGGFRGALSDLDLPSAPGRPILVRSDFGRPQVLRDVYAAGGMAVTVGRIRECPLNHLRMVVLGHNTIRGAAGAAILNGEAYRALGY